MVGSTQIEMVYDTDYAFLATICLYPYDAKIIRDLSSASTYSSTGVETLRIFCRQFMMIFCYGRLLQVSSRRLRFIFPFCASATKSKCFGGTFVSAVGQKGPHVVLALLVVIVSSNETELAEEVGH